MQTKRFLPIFIGLAVGLMVFNFIGCKGTAATNTQKNNPPVDALDGSRWRLISIDGNSLIKGSYISLRFHNGEAGGFAGFSLYGGNYLVQDPATLIISNIFIANSGSSLEATLQQQDAYLKYLEGVASYHFENDHLVIVNTANPKALVFEGLPEYLDPSALVGTKWQLISLNDEPVLEGLSITLSFDSNAQASGQAGPFAYAFHFKDWGEYMGCIGWGDLQITGGADNLTLQNLPPAELQALHYIDCMHMPDNYQFIGNRLEIFTVTGNTLIYQPLTDVKK